MTGTGTIETRPDRDARVAQGASTDSDSERAGGRGPGRLRVGAALAGLVVFGAIILAITLWPQPVDQGHESTVSAVLDLLHTLGAPAWFGYGSLEFSANIVMFLPLGFFLGILLPRRFRWAALVLPSLATIGVESAQLVFLADRSATLLDVVANSLGGWIGAFAGALIVRNRT